MRFVSRESTGYPLIAVTVPIYNTPDGLLKQCVDSILNQTYENLEIILVDDGSASRTGRILDEYANLDSRVKVIHKENGGLSVSRNVGIESSSAEYIVFVDHDDICEPEMVAHGFRELVGSNADIAFWHHRRLVEGQLISSSWKGEFRQIYDEASMWMISCMCLTPSMFPDAGYPYCMCAWGKIYKKALFDGIRFPSPLDGRGEDQVVIQKLLKKCHRVVLFGEELYRYRLLPGSMTKKILHDIALMRIGEFDILESEINFLNDKVQESFDSYRAGFLINECTNYLFHPDCRIRYKEKKALLKHACSMKHYREALSGVKKLNFKKGQFLYLMLLKYKLYDLALLAGWYGARQHYCR